MEKRVFLFLIITFSFLFLYSLWLKNTTPYNSPQKEMIEKKKEVYLPKKKEKTEKIETEKFIVTYSITGGYVKKIFIKPYKEFLPFTNIGYSPQYKDKEFKLIQKDDTVILIYNDLVKEFSFKDYLLKLKIKSKAHGEILFSNLLESNKLSQRYQEVFYQEKDRLKRKPLLRTKESFFKTSFLGTRSRYYCLVIWDEKTREVVLHKENKKRIDWILKTEFPEDEINIYIGPQLQEELKKYNLEKIIHYGAFHSIAVLLIKILIFFNSFTHNWGVSIILLSAAVYLLFFPFTAKSTKAMKKMQEVQLKLQSKIEELKKKYKDNPTRLNKELVELYRQYGVNPAGGCLGGCLPFFLQIPFFIALYQALLRLVELKNARFLWIKDLSSPDRAIFLGFNLPFIGEYLNILPLLLVVLNLLQQRVVQAPMQDSQQKQVGTFFILFIGFIFYHFPSGLVLYWLVQNIFTFIYQWRLNRVSFS